MANRTAASLPGLKPKHQTPQQIFIAKEVYVLKRNDFTPGKLLSGSFELHTCHVIIIYSLNFLIRRNDRENKLKKERREQLQQREDLQLSLLNLPEPARQVRQQQTAPLRGQYQMTIRVRAVSLP